MAKPSKLINDLNSVPNIVGELGLSIAKAQKAFNRDYLLNVQQILSMAKMMMGEVKLDDAGGPVAMTSAEVERLEKFKSLFLDMLTAMAPSRYQFTETTLGVRLDLAQTMSGSATVGLGAGFGGIALNAAFTIGYGYDYRAAAECRTVINAIPADKTVFQPLLTNAKEIRSKDLTLPDAKAVDSEIKEILRDTFEQTMGIKAPKEVTLPEAPVPQDGE